MKKQFITFMILVCFTIQASAQSFQSGNLVYTIISTDPPCLSLDGHVDGTNAQGELIIPETVEHEETVYIVTRIGNEAFYQCSNLVGNLLIPNTIDTIQARSFSFCSGFTGDLIIPNSVRYMGAAAFEWCSGFDGTLVLSNAINRIAISTFEGCLGLSGTLTIPSSVSSIGPAAFGSCSGFTGALVIPESVTELNTPVPPINGIRGTFQECTGFTSLVLPESLRIIGGGEGGEGCFAWCSNLSGTLNLPDSLREIGDGAFAGCVGFTGILTLPDSLTYIGSEAFMGCTGLYGEIVIPHSVTLIDVEAFRYCPGFTSVTLGARLERMEHNVFMDTPIEAIKIHAETPPSLHFNAFNGIDKNIPVYIPCHTLDLYRYTEVWGEFTNFIEDCSLVVDEDGVDGIIVSAFPNPTKAFLYFEYSPDVTPKKIDLYDLQGRLVRRQTTALECINMEGLAAGTYMMRVTLEGGKTFSDKVVKE